MNIKKIAAIFAASFMLSFSAMTCVYADESEEETDETIATQEKSETILSEDSLWDYTIVSDEKTNEEYACIESYHGEDTEITIPDEIDGNVVKQLGDYAFYEKAAITKITISENITDFGNFPFFGCISLKEFEVDEKNDIYEVKDGALLGDDGQLLVCLPAGNTDTEYTIPDGVVALNPAAFACCINLKKVNFPDTLERIGLYCFAECTSLNNVEIPEGVTELDMFNFTGCTSLTDISLPDTMHTIGAGAFSKCTSLTSIEFPMYLQEIGQAAFASTGFTEVEIPSTVQNIGYSAFGFDTDQAGQLVAMDNFTVKGLTGSIAQSYCSEEGNEHITFEAIDEEASSEAQSDDGDKEDKGMSPGIIAGIVICCGAAVAIAIILPLSLRAKKKNYEYSEESGNISDDDYDDEDNDEENDDSDDDDDEEE